MATTWNTTGTFEVAPHVHRIPLPLPGDGLKAVNVYAIEDGDRIVLVDAGSDRKGSLEALERGLASMGAKLTDVGVVLATHGHYDHYGLATELRATSGAEVYLGEHERAMIDAAIDESVYTRWTDERRRWLESHGAGELLPAIERFARDERLETAGDQGRWRRPDRELADGEAVQLRERELVARWTPGHTRGHILYEDRATRLLFVGDHVLGHITPSIGFEPIIDGRALGYFLSSLAAVRNLPVDLALPGHGYPLEDLPGRVDELIAHHRTRLSSCVDSVTLRGVASAAEVASDLAWTRRRHSFSDLDSFNQMLAVSETVAHLELLVTDNRLARRTRPGGSISYESAAARA
jgi:glyoxylase-like metal-dependent hydrolase (beta-lactamase superfamily II)